MRKCLQEYPRALGALLAEVKQTGGSVEAHQRMQRLIAEGGRLRGSIAGKFSSLQTHACPDMKMVLCMAPRCCELSESSAAARQCTIQAVCTGPSEPNIHQWHPCEWNRVGGCWMQSSSRLTNHTRSCRYCRPPCTGIAGCSPSLLTCLSCSRSGGSCTWKTSAQSFGGGSH